MRGDARPMRTGVTADGGQGGHARGLHRGHCPKEQHVTACPEDGGFGSTFRWGSLAVPMPHWADMGVGAVPPERGAHPLDGPVVAPGPPPPGPHAHLVCEGRQRGGGGGYAPQDIPGAQELTALHNTGP